MTAVINVDITEKDGRRIIAARVHIANVAQGYIGRDDSKFYVTCDDTRWTKYDCRDIRSAARALGEHHGIKQAIVNVEDYTR